MTGPTTDVVLAGGRVVLPEGTRDDAWVHVASGRIVAIGAGDRPPETATQDLEGAWLVPGYIDLHMHGGGGHDVTSSLEAMRAAVAFHRGHGTTRTLVSLVTAPVADLARQLEWARQLTASGPTPEGHVVGSHVEGPFLSAVRGGAQNTRYMLAPDPEVLSRLVAAAGGSLRCMTVAPELLGGLDLVTRLVDAGIIAALGHSDAGYAQARAAIDRGASLVTHIFNGMRPLHHREPGLVGAALESDIACELINDGIHTHEAIARLVDRTANRLVLVTDAIDAAGVGDGVFSLGGQQVHVHDGRARLASSDQLAGSTLTMDEAVRRAVFVGGLSIEAASAAASGNPARVLGIGDRAGSIAVGQAADLLVLDDDLRPTSIMAAGHWCNSRSQLEIDERSTGVWSRPID